MLNYLTQFFFAYLSEKTASRILRDNYFAPERKLKLTRPVSRGNRAMTSLRIRTVYGNRNSAIHCKQQPDQSITEFRNKRKIIHTITIDEKIINL